MPTKSSSLRPYHTAVRGTGRATTVRLYATDIVKFSPKSITLDTGGYQTPTTIRRMNEAASQYNLGYSVFQRGGKLFAAKGGKLKAFKGSKVVIKR